MEKKVSNKLEHLFELGRKTAWKLNWCDAPATFKAMKSSRDGEVSCLTSLPVNQLGESSTMSEIEMHRGASAGAARPDTSGKAAQLMCVYVLDHETGDKHPLLVAMRATLHELKVKASLAIGAEAAPLDCMWLCIGGQRLQDHRTLLSYGIQNGECLHLMLRRGVSSRTRKLVTAASSGTQQLEAESQSAWLASLPGSPLNTQSGSASWMQESFEPPALVMEESITPWPSWLELDAEPSAANSRRGSDTLPQHQQHLPPSRQVVVRCPQHAQQQLPPELRLLVPWCATMSEVKRRVAMEIGLPIAHQRLSFLGCVLANHVTVLDCGANPDEELNLQLEHLAAEPELAPNHYVRNARLATRQAAAVDRVGMPVTINETWPSGGCYRVHLADGQGIQRLKERLQKWTGISPQMQILMHRGRILQGDQSTAFYNIKPGDRLELACVGGYRDYQDTLSAVS